MSGVDLGIGAAAGTSGRKTGETCLHDHHHLYITTILYFQICIALHVRYIVAITPSMSLLMYEYALLDPIVDG